MSQRQTKLTVWEPKLQPPHPSTVSDLSEPAQYLIHTLEKKWEQNFARRRPPKVNIGVAIRTPNVMTPLHQGIYNPKYGALPYPTQPHACLPVEMCPYISMTSQVPRQQVNLLDPMLLSPRMQTPAKARSGTLPEPSSPWQPHDIFATQSTRLIMSASELFSQDSWPKSRPESPVLDFGSDEEGQSLFQAITQQSAMSQQVQSKSANLREPNILETIDLSLYDDDLEISAEENKNSQGSELLELENYLQHFPTANEISMNPKLPDEPAKLIIETKNLPKSTNEAISPKLPDAQATIKKSLPELVTITSNPRQKCQTKSPQKSQDLVTKTINAKPNQAKSKPTLLANKSIISQVLGDTQPKGAKPGVKYYSIFQCKRPAEEEKSAMAMSNSMKSTMMPKAKKSKFQAPFKSQETASQDQTTNKESATASDQREKTTILNGEMIQEVTLKLQAKPPMEICICLLYRHSQNQLSTIAEAKNFGKGAATGLMLAVLEENEPVVFYKLPLDFKQQNSNHDNLKFEREFLLDMFDLQCRKVCFNTQELFTFLIYVLQFNYYEVALKWMVMDPLIGCWLLDPDSPPKDFSQALKMLGINQNKDNTNMKSDLKACEDLVLLSKAAEKMYSQLLDRRLWRLFLDLECPIVSMLAVMEVKGIGVDTNRLRDIGNTLEKRLKTLQTEANKLMGTAVLLTSPQQLRKILFDKLKLDAKLNVPLTEQGGGKSTNESVLKLLVPLHPLPGIILEFRHLQKLKSTYVDGILPFIRMGQLRTVWDQTAAATGRLVSRDPNIQAYPKQSVTVQGIAINHSDHVAYNEETQQEMWLRSAFISKGGHSFLSADFQHIELRLFAHFAQDQRLNEMFTKTEDVFEALARQWLGHSTEHQVTNEEREQTKRVVYAVMYGAGMNKLEQVLQVNQNEARKILNTFTGKFPQIKNFSQRLVRRARDQGFITSLSGRRRLFPNISCSDAKLRLQSERQAVNFLIQGSAADICKAAMIRTQQAMNREALQAELMLQIHDELVWEVPNSQLQNFKELVQEAMEGTRAHFKITLPLPVALASGKTWADVS